MNIHHMKGCHLYQEPMFNKQMKPPSMQKVISQKDESGLNSFDNVSESDDTHTKRRQRTKKEKPIEDPSETDERPSKMKDKTKKLGSKK